MPDLPSAQRQAAKDPEGWIAFGRFSRAHGIRGEVRLHEFPNQPHVWSDLNEILVQSRSGTNQIMQLESLRQAQPDQWLVKLKGCDSREEASAFSGATTYLPEDRLPELDEDEYYSYQLLGLQVQSEQGDAIGEVVEFQDMPADDILVVQTPKGRFPLPLVREVIRKIDLAGGKIVVSLPEGLLDLEA